MDQLEQILSSKNSLDDEKKNQIRKGMIDILSRIEQCNQIQTHYQQKNNELNQLQLNFLNLSKLIKEKLNIDKELITEIMKLLDNWTNSDSFKTDYRVKDTELKPLLDEQKDILSNLKTTLNELNSVLETDIPDISEFDIDKLNKLSNSNEPMKEL